MVAVSFFLFRLLLFSSLSYLHRNKSADLCESNSHLSHLDLYLCCTSLSLSPSLPLSILRRKIAERMIFIRKGKKKYFSPSKLVQRWHNWRRKTPRSEGKRAQRKRKLPPRRCISPFTSETRRVCELSLILAFGINYPD